MSVPSNSPAQSPSRRYVPFIVGAQSRPTTSGDGSGTGRSRSGSKIGTPQKKNQLTISDLIDAAAATEWSSQPHNYTHTDYEMTFDTSKITAADATVTPFDTEFKRHAEYVTLGSVFNADSFNCKRRMFLQSTPIHSDQPIEFNLEFPEPKMDFFLDDDANFPSSAPQSAQSAHNTAMSPLPAGAVALPILPSLSSLLIERPVIKKEPSESPKRPQIFKLDLRCPVMPSSLRSDHIEQAMKLQNSQFTRLRQRKSINYTEPEADDIRPTPTAVGSPEPDMKPDVAKLLKCKVKRSIPTYIRRNDPAFRPCAPLAQPKKARRHLMKPRSKGGCWTCRIRKKKCSEVKPLCKECIHLELKCDGYDEIKPAFMHSQAGLRKRLDEIKQQTSLKKKIGVKKR